MVLMFSCALSGDFDGFRQSAKKFGAPPTAEPVNLRMFILPQAVRAKQMLELTPDLEALSRVDCLSQPTHVGSSSDSDSGNFQSRGRRCRHFRLSCTRVNIDASITRARTKAGEFLFHKNLLIDQIHKWSRQGKLTSNSHEVREARIKLQSICREEKNVNIVSKSITRLRRFSSAAINFFFHPQVLLACVSYDDRMTMSSLVTSKNAEFHWHVQLTAAMKRSASPMNRVTVSLQ